MSKKVCIHGIDLDIACNECSPPFVDFWITPKTNKAHNFSQEQEDRDIAYLKKIILEALRIPKEYLMESEE
jgi:hypothetical protein